MRLSPDITDRITGIVTAYSKHCTSEPLTVFDVGCGDGSLLTVLSGNGYRLTGLDVKECCGGSRTEFAFVPGRAEALPFADGMADIVILQCVFSLCEPERTAAQAARVIKPGGLLILTDLYTEQRTVSADGSELLGKIYRKSELEEYFGKGFVLRSFQDETARMTDMLLQAVMSGEACASAKDLKLLRQIKARYGLWTMTAKEKQADCLRD